MFILEVSAGVSAFVLQTDIHELLDHTITEALNDSPNNNVSSHMMDVLQSEVFSAVFLYRVSQITLLEILFVLVLKINNIVLNINFHNTF